MRSPAITTEVVLTREVLQRRNDVGGMTIRTGVRFHGNPPSALVRVAGEQGSEKLDFDYRTPDAGRASA